MPKQNTVWPKIIRAGLIGGLIFSGIVVGLNFLLTGNISILKALVYFVIGALLYGFLAYRSSKKSSN